MVYLVFYSVVDQVPGKRTVERTLISYLHLFSKQKYEKNRRDINIFMLCGLKFDIVSNLNKASY